MWTYKISTGQLFDPSGVQIARGYAGNGQYKNDPKSVAIRMHGPLPPGRYTIGKAYDHPHVGKFAMPLTPYATNEMYGRSEFFMHGDSISNPGNASDGCVIQPLVARKKVDLSGDKVLNVIE